MDQTARLPLGGRRWEAYVKTLRFAGVDLTGATFLMDLRLYRNAPGAPALALRTVGNGNAEGLRLIGVEQINGQPVSVVSIKVNETTMEGLPFLGEAGSDSVLVYDLQIDRPGGYKRVWLEGEFWVLAAVTGADSAKPGIVDGSGIHRPRPSFAPGAASFQVGDSVVTVEVAAGEGPPGQDGEDGADAAPPARVDFTTTAGQVRFPAAGDFGDLDPPFSYDGAVVVKLNGLGITPGLDYDAPGGITPIVFTQPLPAGQQVSIHSFELEGTDDGGALKRMSFSIRKSAYQKMTEAIALDDARESNATDENDALAELLNDGYRTIRLVGGLGSRNGRYAWGAIPFKGLREGFKPGQPGYVPNDPDATHYEEHPGSFTLANGQKAHGLTLFGDGMGRTFVDQIDNYMLAHATGSEDVNDNLFDLTLRDMTLSGRGGQQHPAEHLLSFAGMKRLLLLRMRLTAFRGDGLTLWPGPSGRVWNHNESVRVLASVFDGVNNQNRNGISGEDIVGLRVEGTDFLNIGVPDDGISVADVDIEPRDNQKYRVGRVALVGNTHVGSGRAAAAFYVNGPDNYLLAPQGFSMRGSTIRGAHRGIDCLGVFTPFLGGMKKRHVISVTDNQLIDVEVPLRAGGTYGLDFIDNQLENTGSVILGVDGIGRGNKDIRVSGNTLYRAGRTNGAPILIDDATLGDSVIEGNHIIEGGIQAYTGGPGWPVLIRYGQQSVRILDNVVTNVEGRLKADISMGTDGSIGAGAANRGNTVSGVALAAGNFNPPTAPSGIYRDFTFPANAVVNGGTTGVYDIDVVGAFIGMAFDAVPLFGVGSRMAQAGLTMDAFVKENYVVRLTITPAAALDLSGQTIRIIQRS